MGAVAELDASRHGGEWTSGPELTNMALCAVSSRRLLRRLMETDHQHVEDGGTNSPLVSMDVSTLRVSPLGWGEGAAGSSSPPAGRTCFGCFTAKVKCEKTTPCKR